MKTIVQSIIMSWFLVTVMMVSPSRADEKNDVEAYTHQLQQTYQLSNEQADMIKNAMHQYMHQHAYKFKQASQLVEQQLKQKWQATDIDQTAMLAQQFQHNKRWQNQAMNLIKTCAQNGQCDPQAMQISLQLMQEASHSPDIDARQTKRMMVQMLGDHYQKQMKLKVQTKEKIQAKTKIQDGQYEKLQKQMRKQLKLAQENAIKSGQEKQMQYRHAIQSEIQRGGTYGGTESTQVGAGFGNSPGQTSGQGNGKK